MANLTGSEHKVTTLFLATCDFNCDGRTDVSPFEWANHYAEAFAEQRGRLGPLFHRAVGSSRTHFVSVASPSWGLSRRTISHCCVVPSAEWMSAGVVSWVRFPMPVSITGNCLSLGTQAARCVSLSTMPSIW